MTRPEHNDPEVIAAAAALRKIHVSWLRGLRSKGSTEDDREWCAREVAWRMLNPHAGWTGIEVERGLPR
jgi:hypothetical protein